MAQAHHPRVGFRKSETGAGLAKPLENSAWVARRITQGGIGLAAKRLGGSDEIGRAVRAQRCEAFFGQAFDPLVLAPGAAGDPLERS